MIYGFVAICLFGSVLAQVPGDGPCADVQTVKDFDITKYMGRWYAEARYMAPFEADAKCMMADYTLHDNGTVEIASSQISEKTGILTKGQAMIEMPNAAEASKLRIKFPTMPGVEADYWVLGTDYDSFTVVFSCSIVDSKSQTYAWILTRDRNPSADVIAKADKVIADSKISRSSFVKVDQTGCEQS